MPFLTLLLTELNIGPSSGTQQTTACSGSALLTRKRTGGPGPSSTSSSSNACLLLTGRSSHGSSSLRTVFLATRPAPTTSQRARSRNPWGGKRCRSSGRSTRSISPSMDTSTATKGHAQSIRCAFSFHLQSDQPLVCTQLFLLHCLLSETCMSCYTHPYA